MQKPSSERTPSDHPSSGWFDRLIPAAGVLLIALGLAVILGWHSGITFHARPMVWNTAIGFIFAGAAIISTHLGRPRIAEICSVFVGLLGFLTLGEYVFALNLGIDQLVVESSTEAAHPGRMAPNTALCFAMAGIVLWLQRRRNVPTGAGLLIVLLASAVFAIGTTGLVGYALGIEPAYGWGAFARMAIHTAIGFMILGGTLLSVAWNKERATASVGLTFFLGLSFSLMAFAVLRDGEARRMAIAFEDTADDRITIIEREFSRHIELVRTIASLYAASETVERGEFRAFVLEALQHHDDEAAIGEKFMSLEWLPRVLESARLEYEAAGRRDGYGDFQFIDRLSDGRYVPAGKRPEYYPVYFTEPPRQGLSSLGLDRWHDPASRRAMERARDLGKTVAAEPMEFVSASGGEPARIGFMVFVPIYRKETAHDTVERKRAELMGYVAGLIDIPGVTEEALALLKPGGVDLYLCERADSETRLLYYHPSRARQGPAAADLQKALASPLKEEVVMKLGEREWRVVSVPAPGNFEIALSAPSVGILSTGLLLTGLLTIYLGGAAQRAARVNRLVQERTTELKLSQERYRGIVEDQTEYICRYRPDSTFTFVNDAYCVLKGKPREKLIGKRLCDMIDDPEKRRLFEDHLAKLNQLTPADPVRFGESSDIHGDGRLHWRHWVDRAIFDEKGRLVEIQAVGRDVTRQKEAELQLNLQYEMTRILAEARSIDEAAPKLLKAVCEVTGWDVGQIWTVNYALKELQRVHTWCKPGIDIASFEEVSSKMHFSKGIGLPGRIWEKESGAWIEEVQEDSNFPRAPAAREAGIHSAFGMPITYGGEFLGAGEFFSRRSRKPDADLLRLAEQIGAQIGQFIQRMRAEQALRESEARSRLLLESTGEGIYGVNTLGRCTFINQAGAGILGYTVDEVLGKDTHVLFHHSKPDKSPYPAEQSPTEKVYKTGQPCRMSDEVYWKKNGSPVPVQYCSYPIWDDRGTIGGAVVVFSDITELKQAEAERVRMVSILEATSDCVGISTPDGHQMYLNHAGRKMLGYEEKEDISGRPIAECHPPWAMDVILNVGIPTAIRDGSWSGETAIYGPGKQEVPVSQVILAYKNPLGAVEYMATIIRDLSKIKRAEEELVRLSSAINNAAEAVVVTDLEARIQYVNPSFEKITGYRREELLGKKPSILKSGKHGDDFYKHLWETLSRGETWTGAFINRKKDGSLFHESASIAPVRDPSGKVIGYVAVKKDITEQIQLEGQVRHAQKMEAVGQMAGGIAHDFNNALASMLGYAKLARDAIPKGSEVREDVELVLKAGERARQLVDQLLAFSRQSPRKEGKSSVSLGSIIKETMKLIRPTIPSNVEIKLDIAPHLSPILADPTQIHQVAVNLCLNAAQAMDHGGTMTIGLQDLAISEEDGKRISPEGRERLEAGHYVVLTVQDTGKGISKENLPRIFEPFFTTKKFGGGMGLAVVFGIVKAHHGDISIYSEAGIGTAVKVYLPVALSAAKSEGHSGLAQVKGGAESILVVDDEEMLGRMMGRTLGKLGYRVTVRTAAQEALELFSAAPRDFDLVVSDQTMPKMTGDKLAEEIHRIRPDIPVILCSGFSEILTPERAKEISVFNVVRKPFMNDELEREIRKALDQCTASKKGLK